MIVLDTDHLSVLKYQGSEAGSRLAARLQGSGDPIIATTIVTFEEQMRGWLAEIHRQRVVHDQVEGYRRLLRTFQMFENLVLLPFDLPAADEFERQRKAKVRIGTMDLKIACIALTHNALLLSANRRDFGQVPGLRLENWLEV